MSCNRPAIWPSQSLYAPTHNPWVAGSSPARPTSRLLFAHRMRDRCTSCNRDWRAPAGGARREFGSIRELASGVTRPSVASGSRLDQFPGEDRRRLMAPRGAQADRGQRVVSPQGRVEPLVQEPSRLLRVVVGRPRIPFTDRGIVSRGHERVPRVALRVQPRQPQIRPALRKGPRRFHARSRRGWAGCPGPRGIRLAAK